MTQTPTFFNRLGKLFRRSSSNGNGEVDSLNQNSPSVTVETRPALLRTWGRNNAAIAQLQEGFHLLTDLMGTIKQNMESQGRRQDELINHVAALPRILETIPESTRLQSEALRAIHQQIISQSQQQQVLGEILEKLAQSDGDQKDLLEGLRERVETLNQQDKAIADNMSTVGSALESVSRNSAASTEVLGRIRDSFASRENSLENVLQGQAKRFTIMLATAVFLSIAAMIAVVVMGYFMMHSGK
jgi:chromosome segregation ATPase